MDTFRPVDRVMHVRTALRGRALLTNPLLNKSTAFSAEERATFGLEGLLPDVVNTLEMQAQRAYANIARKTEPLERYIGLAALQDRNEVLFYKVLEDHLEDLLPIVYTPTVGQACQLYSRIFRRPRGIWITSRHRGRIDQVLGNARYQDVRLIVVTDNERILGLGDQGAGGIGIPIGKLSLYSLAAGIPPWRTLPISLDVGTDNEELLADPMYVGVREKRLRGPAYHSLVEEFVEAVKTRFPHALLQWEDFKKGNAFDLLDRYRKRLPSFNDDIQGTAAIALAGVMAAARASGIPMRDQRILILGAGAAGVGIARQLRDALARAGVKGDALTRAIALIDSKGLLVEGQRMDEPYKAEFTWPRALVAELGLSDEKRNDLPALVHALEPTALIGTSGQPGIIDEATTRAMAEVTRRPAIFPFSNPTSLSEAKPADLIRWTDGRALVATGSPFEPVEHAGRRHRIGQGNNVYIFPGVGLGALVGHAREVTDAMFTVAAETVAKAVSEQDLAEGALYPPISRLRSIATAIAAAVVREAHASGVGSDIDDPEATVRTAMWSPHYPVIEPA